MPDRFIRMLVIEEAKWSKGCPVIMEKAALLHDHLQSANLLQIQFKNVQLKSIKAMNIVVLGYDEKNESYDKVEFSYKDLSVGANLVFGGNIPVYLKSIFARSFTFLVRNVLFGDGSVWNNNIEMTNIEQPQKTTKLGELEPYYIQEMKKSYPYVNVSTIPEQKDGYWYCACGAIVPSEYILCTSCNADINEIIAIAEIDRLRNNMKEAEQKRLIALEQKRIADKKRSKIILLVVSILLIIISTISYVGSIREELSAYNHAKELLQKGLYSRAAKEFEELDGFWNSEKLILEAYFLRAKAYMEDEDYDNAIELFLKNENYKNSSELLNESKYLKAEKLYEKEDYESAVEIYAELGDYKDSPQKLTELNELIEKAEADAKAKADADKKAKAEAIAKAEAEADAKAKAKAEADAAAAAKAKADAEAAAAKEEAIFKIWNGTWNAYQKSGDESPFVGQWTINMSNRTVNISGAVYQITLASETKITFGSYAFTLTKSSVASGNGYTLRK